MTLLRLKEQEMVVAGEAIGEMDLKDKWRRARGVYRIGRRENGRVYLEIRSYSLELRGEVGCIFFLPA